MLVDEDDWSVALPGFGPDSLIGMGDRWRQPGSCPVPGRRGSGGASADRVRSPPGTWLACCAGREAGEFFFPADG
jgi:hypothetical protein